MEAKGYLDEAARLLNQRGQTYQSSAGERSMSRIVGTFNTLTGADMSISDGWLFMLLLKLVRARNAPAWHPDSYKDAVAYAALLAEQAQDEAEF